MDIDYALSRLPVHSSVLSALLASVDQQIAAWRPSPGKWSMLEIINHLADEETEDFRARLDATLHRPEEEYQPIDPEAAVVERRYNERDIAESLRRFITARVETLQWLRSLKYPDLSTSRTHPQFGTIRAGDLLAAWVEHDLRHIRQIVEVQRALLLERVAPYSVQYAG